MTTKKSMTKPTYIFHRKFFTIIKIFRKIYDSMYENLQPETIPHAVLIIADYQYKSAFVADQEINLVACLTELMSQVKFK